MRCRSAPIRWVAATATLWPFVAVTAVGGWQAGCAKPSASVLGYITNIPPEPPQARAERHKRVAERRVGLPIIVHRGLSRIAPENTLDAYAAAMDAGADGVEIDIRRTTDGVLFLFHDDDLDRLTRESGKVGRLSYYELLKITPRDVYGPATRDTRPPTLAALLVLARQRAALLHLDIKEAGLQEDVAGVLDAADTWDHVVEINAYNSDRLRANPKVTLIPYEGWVPEDADLAVIRRFLDDAHRQGKMVICDDPRSAVRAFGREAPGSVPLPEGIRAEWTPAGVIVTGSPAAVAKP